MQRNTVAYNEGHTLKLENKLLLGEDISDLPEVRGLSSWSIRSSETEALLKKVFLF